MVFSSLLFLYLFLPLNLILYHLTKSLKIKNLILIVFSLLFYAWGEPVWVSLLIFSASIDYLHGRIIEKHRNNWRSKAALISSVVLNLSLLGFFKYYGFFIENINALFDISLTVKTFGLPIGISFYTFQTVSYTVDVYRREVSAQKSYLKFLMFVSLFHQLVAGPIVRYKDINAEIEKRVITIERVKYGIFRFATGLGKKIIFANTAGEIASYYLENSFVHLTQLGAWYGILMFSLQIYFDFSGYSDMAIGLGHLFGFTYKENFNYPYVARSATDFWRRWHISLGSFFRDYVYIPLGGNRKHPYRNLFIVWFLTGMWHGASWNFILWGLYFGVLIFIEKAFKDKFKIPKVMGHLYLIVVVLFGWVIFYFEDIGLMKDYLLIMTGIKQTSFTTPHLMMKIVNNLYFLIGALVLCTPVVKHIAIKLKVKVSSYDVVFETVYAVGLLYVVTALLVSQSYNPFLYFRF